MRVRAPGEIEGPIQRGERLGTATVFVEGRRVGTVPLRAGRAIPKAGFFDRARATVADNLIPIADRGVRDTHGSGAAPVAPAHPRKRPLGVNGVKGK